MIKMLNLVSANAFVELFYAEIEERIPYPSVSAMVHIALDSGTVKQVICDIINEYRDDKYTYIDAYAYCDRILSYDAAWDTFGSKLAHPIREVLIDTLSDVVNAIDATANTEYAPAVSYQF